MYELNKKCLYCDSIYIQSYKSNQETCYECGKAWNKNHILAYGYDFNQQIGNTAGDPIFTRTPKDIQDTEATTKVFNLSKQASEGSVEMLCGKVYKHKFGVGSKSEHEAVFLLTDNGEEYKLRRSQAEDPFNDPDLDKLVGERICGKGMIHKYLFIVSEYNVVNLEKDQQIVETTKKLPDDMIPFDVGDTVRHRQRGLAFQQIKGRVDRIDHGLMYIKWDGVKEVEVFSLADPVAIFGILQKA